MRCWFVICLTFFASAAGAQTVGIRSGEHEDFTRFVFYFEDPTEWSLGRVEDGFRFDVTPAPAEFDTSEAFTRIGRTRVAQIAPSAAGELVLQLACDCHAIAFQVAPLIVAVDIRDGKAPPENRFERRVDLIESEPMDLPVESRDIADTSPRAAPAVILPIVTPTSVPASVPFVVPEEKSATAEPDEMAEGNSGLTEDVARAASQGLLTVVAPPGETDVSLSQTNIDALEQVAIDTSIDRAFASVLDALEVTNDGGACVPESKLDIASWAPEPPDFGVISAKREKLVNARGDIQRAAAIDLAKAYLNFGFGAEARQVITAFAPTDETAQLLLGMADILDENDTRSPMQDMFEKQSSCLSNVSMWAALSTSEPSQLADLNAASVLRTFSALPLHLRKLLGGRLAERFLAIGDVASARIAQEAIARATPDLSPTQVATEAELDIAAGDIQAAQARLRAVVDAGGTGAPEALARLLGVLHQSGQTASTSLRDLAAAYAYEHRETELGDTLAVADIIAKADAGAFDEGLEALRRARWSASASQEPRRAADALFAALAADASDADFLRLSFSEPDLAFSPQAGAVTRRAMAARLVDVGLPEMAMTLLQSDLTEDTQITLARAELALGRPRNALEYVADLVKPEARRLAAQARNQITDYRTAADTYAEIDDVASAASAAWRAGDWERVGEIGTPAQQAAANRLTAREREAATISGLDPDDITLAASQTALAQAAETRRVLEALLASTTEDESVSP